MPRRRLTPLLYTLSTNPNARPKRTPKFVAAARWYLTPRITSGPKVAGVNGMISQQPANPVRGKPVKPGWRQTGKPPVLSGRDRGPPTGHGCNQRHGKALSPKTRLELRHRFYSKPAELNARRRRWIGTIRLNHPPIQPRLRNMNRCNNRTGNCGHGGQLLYPFLVK